MKEKSEYFTKFPNAYIQGNIKTKFDVGRKFYITYILIDKYRSYENFSWITVRKILEFYGYKTTSRKPKAFKEVLDVFEYMINNNMIEIQQNLDSLGYDTGIEIKIISENFDYTNNFSKLTSSQFEGIMMSDSSINKESLLIAFLYINSYINTRPRSKDGTETMQNPNTKPEAFWRSIESMAKELSMSKDTIVKCVDCLTTSTAKRKALLMKKVGGSVKKEGKPPQNVPNIYVINKKGYEKEIEWALDKMKEIYRVDSFEKIKYGNKEKHKEG